MADAMEDVAEAEDSSGEVGRHDEAIEDVDRDPSDDDSSDDEVSAKRAVQIEELEAQIMANLYNYDPHVALLKLLKEEGDLAKLRAARRRMSQAFPLAEELWLEWLRDEMSLAVDCPEKEAILELFENAVKDYLSVDIWCEYVQFATGYEWPDDRIAKCRDICERAVTAAGLHVANGSLVWDTYREFEMAVFHAYLPQPNTVSESEYEAAKETASNRLLTLFRRQLSVPLIGMEKTYEEFLEMFPESGNDSSISSSYQKALAKLAKIQPFEDELLLAESPRLDAYKAYIDFEMKQGEPTRIQSIFERALADNCLQPELWIRYTQYLDRELKLGTLALPLYERAVRNCPWSVELWRYYLRAMERYDQPRDKIQGLGYRALESGFTRAEEFLQLWMALLEYLSRQLSTLDQESTGQDGSKPAIFDTLRDTFQQAIDYLAQAFGTDGDPACTVHRMWAEVEAHHCKNVEKARDLWNEVVQMGHGQQASTWLSFANFERTYGDQKHVRRTFSRGLQATLDWPETVGQAWIDYERCHGTLEQLEWAETKCSARMKIIQVKRSQEAVHESEIKSEKKRKGKKGNLKKEMPLKSESSSQLLSSTKRKISVGDRDVELDKEGFKVPPPPVVKSRGEPDSEGPKAKKLKVESKGEGGREGKRPIKHDVTRDSRTIFLSNLDYGLEDERIRELLSKCGEILELRLVRNFRGRSKGYCYVEFATQEAAAAALGLDREPIDGRPMFVSPSVDKSNTSQSKFKYDTGLEKNKLFIRGLPFTMTKEKLEEQFGPYGELKEIRLVTHKSGKFKGLAYVEYVDESSAATALLETDGRVLDEHSISVALSNPPSRGAGGERDSRQQGRIKSLGEQSSRPTGPRGRGRTQVQLVPRALQRTRPTTAPGRASQNGDAVNGCSENGATGTVPSTSSRPMSNRDFRSMLLEN